METVADEKGRKPSSLGVRVQGTSYLQRSTIPFH